MIALSYLGLAIGFSVAVLLLRFAFEIARYEPKRKWDERPADVMIKTLTQKIK